MPIGGLSLIIPSLILVAGVVNDIHSQKVHNGLVLLALGLAACGLVATQGIGGLPHGLLAGGLAFGLGLPLFVLGILGGGDIKLYIAFGLATANPSVVFWVLIYSFFWGALLGLTQSLLSGNLKLLLGKLVYAFTQNPKDAISVAKIPYTVAFLFGWLTHLTQQGWSLI